ncbi:hypothetical protein [Methanococcoides sp. NM1]|uniref:hypothetical protein n=1 Tax=Methanococcoides sp. NM1 TaxID=1201013 RepID=UPI001083FAA8|nr:hypothetical protein [Methanococcoides sp. NM1]
MRHCEKCETECPDSIDFCPECKSLLKKGMYKATYKDGDDIAICKKCGTKHSKDSLSSDGVCLACLYNKERLKYEYKHN